MFLVNYVKSIIDTTSDVETTVTLKVFPNYILIKILNYLLINDFGTTITLERKTSNRFCFHNFILKLSMVSKSWEKDIVPHLNYQMVKIRFKRDVIDICKLIQKGVNKYPLINLNKLDIDFPNVISPVQTNEVKQLTLLTNTGHKFEKVRLTTAMVPKEDQIEIPTMLTDFITSLNGLSELELYNIPAIRVGNTYIDPKIKYTNIIQYSRLNNPTFNIEHLTLKNQLLSCERIVDLIDLFPRLRTLDLTNNRIGVDYSTSFTYAISTAIQLTSLKLSSNVLKSHLNELLPTMTNLPLCNTLDISENYCDDECSKEIATLISTNKSITSLNISSNIFKQVGMNEIMTSLSKNKGVLVELILSNFQIFNSSLFGDYLSSNASLNLKHLNLSNSNISGNSIPILKSLYDGFKNGNTNSKSLISFDASNITIREIEEFELLSNVLTNCNISKIKLSRVFQAKIPCEFLFSNLSSSITDLDISTNHIMSMNHLGSDRLGIELSDIISQNKSIVKLNLTGTGINNLSISYIFNSLSTNSTLTNLNLSRNNIHLMNMDYTFLKLNKSLITLDLSHNPIRNKEMVELFEAFKFNTSVTHLNIQSSHMVQPMVFPNMSKRKTKFQEIKTNLSFKSCKSLSNTSYNIQYDTNSFNSSYHITNYALDESVVALETASLYVAK